MSKNQVIGFIGLGNMGLPMVCNLSEKLQKNILVYDVYQEVYKNLPSRCQTACLEEISKQCNIIFTMLPSHEDVAEVHAKIKNTLTKDDILVDCSTSDFNATINLHKHASEIGVHMLDAPVSGGIMGAKQATLTFMCGGAEDVFKQVKPLLELMGKNVFLCGKAGSGQATKMCNNLSLSIQMLGVCESFKLAEKLGLDPKVLFDVSSVSSGRCWSLDVYCPEPNVLETAPSSHDYKNGFMAKLILKDIRLALQAAKNCEITLPFGIESARMYQRLCDELYPEVDFSAIIKLVKQN